ncbi:DUF2130 domain-containing protein [Candidatus Gracilibacteria bacterium]|nr:DUF2130 domain-containing protein [Candidatus Gracilibacteria bacterium]
MADQTITCPKCGEQIQLNDALTGKIREQLKGEIEKGVLEKEKQLAIKEKAVAESQKNIDEQVSKKLDAEKTKIMAIAKEEAGKKLELEMQNLVKADEEKEKELEEMRKQAIASMDKARELETKDKKRELEFAQKMDEATRKIAEQAKLEADEASKKKLLEKDKTIEQMQKALEEAQRKAEQGSMQIQGDAQETDLKLALQSAFMSDTVEDIATGTKGADLLQTVFSSMGQKQGVILWESKNTKNWKEEWVRKLKDDQAHVKADVVIIATQVLPEDVETFGFRDGVWITAYKYALPLVAALRYQLSEMSKVKQSLVGKDAKMELLYNYLGGAEFKNRIETIVLAFGSLKKGLDAEKRAMEKIWNKREKEIDRVMKNTAGFHGDLEGIMGAAALPSISALELGSGEEEEI